MLFFLSVLFVVAFFYEWARKRKNNSLMNLFIGIGAFFIGLFVSIFLGDVILLFIPEITEGLQTAIRLVLSIMTIWATYRGLKSLLNPTKKKTANTALDADLISGKQDDHNKQSFAGDNKSER